MNSELHDYGSVVLSDANSGLRSNAEIANSSGGTALTDNRARVPELPEPSRKRGRGPMLSSRRALPPGVSFNVDETAREVQSAFRTFILQFSNNGENVYCDQIHHMVANDITTLYVDATHVALFHQDLSDAIRQEFYRFETALRSALDSVVKELHPEHSLNEERSAEIYHKEYYVSMYNLENVSKIREIRADMIGQLISISGTVTRTSEVRPELISGTFACNQCSQIIKDVQQQFVYSTVSFHFCPFPFFSL